MKIKYIHHSSFLVELEDRYMLFDYFGKGKIPKLEKGKMLYVFCSHSHGDHYNDIIFDIFSTHDKVRYIISDDAEYMAKDCISGKGADIEKKILENTVFVSANCRYEIDGFSIETLESTDEGVAFFIEINGKNIYYAGDLNWWTWKGFETEEEFEDLTFRFKREIDKIKGRNIDVAFIVLDKRQGERYFWGMKYFLENTNTKTVVPMHCWGDFSLIDRFSKDYKDVLKDTVMIHTDKIKDGTEI